MVSYRPVMDGIEATKRIRQFNKTVSIVAVTAAANKQKECLEAGFLLSLDTPLQFYCVSDVFRCK